MKGKRKGKKGKEKIRRRRWRERKGEKKKTYTRTGRRDPLYTCLLSTFGSRGNKRRKAVRREVYGRGINYRRFRAFLRNSPRYMRVDITLTTLPVQRSKVTNDES